ncbi:MAG: cytidine deaminase [Acutalibacteraceae bacterium]
MKRGMKMTDNELVKKAIDALENSYSPYSSFRVGAALLAADGRFFCGCNIENASYPAGICAERTAVGNAVSAGAKELLKIAIVGGRDGIITDYCPPCGICRQVLSELCGEDFEILLYNGEKIKSYKLSELLPQSFGRKDLCE